MGSLVAELAEKLSSATNNLDFDEQTMFLNTSANTVGIGTNAPASKLDVRGTMQVGVDDTGYDVKLFGDTASRYWLWDTSADGVVQRGTLTVGVNDTGHDVIFYGAAAGAMMMWDESADSLLVRGATADAAGSSGRIVLQTAQVAVENDDILGRIDFQAPLESGGTDAILVGASVWGEAEQSFHGADNSTALVFATNTSAAATERMRITSAGNVGIGTAAPETFLHVGDSASGTAGYTGQKLVVATTLATVYDGTASNSWQGLKTTNADGTSNRTATGLTFDHRTSSSGVAAILSTSAAADRADIRFITRGSGGIGERMMIDDAGNVGFGTATVPDGTGDCTLKVGGVRGCIIQDVVGQQSMYGYNAVHDGTGWVNTGYDGTSCGMRLKEEGFQFHVGNAGSAGGTLSNWDGSDERMVIKTDGEIAGNFSDTSDKILKENFEKVKLGISTIKKLNPVLFDWKDSKKRYAGFVAQDVEKAVPYIVSGKEGKKTIKVGGILSYAVKAIQELSEKVDAQEKELQALRA